MSSEERNAEAISENDTVNEDDWVKKVATNLAVRLPVSAILHPFEYAKILIQLGYDPVPPRSTYTFFGRPALALPNIFEYVGHIRRRVGLLHLYQGVVPRLIGTTVHTYMFHYVSQKSTHILNFEADNGNGEVDDNLDEISSSQQERVLRFFLSTVRDMASQTAAIVVSHPFQVITVRMVAQFIGGEEAYRFMLSSIGDIYKESGILGFFSGLIPRLLGEMLTLWICSSLTFVFNTYLVKDKEIRPYTGAVMSLIASTVTYPYTLVSRITMVNGSGMKASLPPYMPIYNGWIDCWQQLRMQNQLKRGSSMLWRYYTGPVVLKDGKAQAAISLNFQRPTASKY
ncbi:hypothetical protein CHUAL_005029 [Chamberlinius hualienensis]